jgi:hypothetical protein
MFSLTMLRPPSLEETVGGLAEQLPQILTQGFGEVGVDLGRLDAGMSKQHLDNADVHAPLEQVRGKAMPERVRSKLAVEAALASRFVESGAYGRIGHVAGESATGE